MISQLANCASSMSDTEVEIFILTKQPHFFKLQPNINIIEPDFVIEQMLRVQYQWKNFWWLRKSLKKSNSKAFLSFGGKYNSFVLLASLGLRKRVYVSDRSKPGISYGAFLDLLNPITYRLASGIVAQTIKAKEFLSKQTNHKNIKIIPNPVFFPKDPESKKKHIILNVGRFISSKHQDWLINYFNEIQPDGWKLMFLGNGERQKMIKKLAQQSTNPLSIVFKNNVEDVEKYYEAAIFAFTSTSEGFPNALAEAMAHGCACISFDCIAGPSELIDNSINGFLIPEGNDQLYIEKLRQLINDRDLREKFSLKAREKLKQFDVNVITNKYLDFMLRED